MFCIGVNAQLLSGEFGYRRAGIHHYIAQVLQNLPVDERLSYVIFSDNEGRWLREDFKKVRPPWRTESPLRRILWEQFVWPFEARKYQLDMLHSMAFVTPLWQPRPTMLTVYDLSFIHFPNRFPPLKRFYLRSQTRRSCRNARRVVTISESGRQDVHHYFNVPLERIDVVQPGVDETFHPYQPAEITSFRARQQLHSRQQRFIKQAPLCQILFNGIYRNVEIREIRDIPGNISGLGLLPVANFYSRLLLALDRVVTRCA